MATLNEIYNNIFSDSASELRNRCMASVLKSAAYVLIEAPETANHANRLAWARATLASEATLKAAAEKMYIGLASNATIQAAGNAASDNDIDWVVATLLDTVYAAG